MPDLKEFKTVSQAAVSIGVTTGRIRQMIRDNLIAAEKLPGDTSGRWLIHHTEVERVKDDVPKTGRPRTGSI